MVFQQSWICGESVVDFLFVETEEQGENLRPKE